jgi:hypothetical protein
MTLGGTNHQICLFKTALHSLLLLVRDVIINMTNLIQTATMTKLSTMERDITIPTNHGQHRQVLH